MNFVNDLQNLLQLNNNNNIDNCDYFDNKNNYINIENLIVYNLNNKIITEQETQND